MADVDSSFLSAESVPAAAEGPAAGQSRAEPEAEDRQRAVRAVCQGEACQKQLSGTSVPACTPTLCFYSEVSGIPTPVKCVKNKSTLHSYGATISSAAEAKQHLEGDTPADVTDHLRMCFSLCGCGNLPELLFCFLFVL